MLLAFGARVTVSEAHTFLLSLSLLTLLKFATENGVHDVLHAGGEEKRGAPTARVAPANEMEEEIRVVEVNPAS